METQLPLEINIDLYVYGRKNIVPAVIILEILVSHHLSDCQF